MSSQREVRSVLLAAGVAIAAFAGSACGGARPLRAGWPDAPFALRDAGDRVASTDAMWAMPMGAARDRIRAQIAAATVARIREALDDDRTVDAGRLFDDLVALWQADASGIGAGLAPYVGVIRELRTTFAKFGALDSVVRILAVLVEIDAAGRDHALAELDEVLAFADDLAISELGPDAVRASPIALLQPAATTLPLPWLVDRYLELVVERQNVVSRLLDRHGASLELVRAHRDILVTSRRVAIALAYAQRLGELERVLGRMQAASIGIDRDLVVKAEVVADQPTPGAYVALATTLREGEHATDVGAAFAIELAGLARFPGSAELMLAAAGDAKDLGRTEQAIALYERVLGTGEPDATSALRLGKLYGERIERLASGGRPHAAQVAWRGVVAFAATASRRRPHPMWQQTVALAETALGRGLASQGLVDAGRSSLTAAIERAPSIDAYQALTTIAIQVDQLAVADQWASDGLAFIGGASMGHRYQRAKLERLDADALRLAGRTKDAAVRYVDSLRAWASLGEATELPRAIAAERMLESGRALWWLGDTDRGAALVDQAVDAAPDGSPNAATAVAFFIQVGRFDAAVDAYHRGLEDPTVPEAYKVYASLWVLAEARRQALAPDRLAREYLGGREGELWYELLAKAATGRLAYGALAAAAITGPQRGELAFYGAVLGLAPEAATPVGRARLLRAAVNAHVLFDAEYDLARLYLRLAP